MSCCHTYTGNGGEVREVKIVSEFLFLLTVNVASYFIYKWLEKNSGDNDSL